MTPTAAGKEAVLAAFEALDEAAIRRLGWWSPWEAADTLWAPRQTCNARKFIPYVKTLGGEDPVRVAEAFYELANSSKFLPSPAEVSVHLRGKVADESSSSALATARAARRRAKEIEAVAGALKAGELPCEHEGYHPSRFRHDPAGVLRCRDCRGLEHGQVHAVEDAATMVAEAA